MSQLERIVAACGGQIMDAGRRALIPGPGHSPRDRSVSLMETEEGRILIYCFSPKDDWRDVRRELRDRGLLGADNEPEHHANWTATKPQETSRFERRAHAKRIWDEGRPLRATAGERYLLRRALRPEFIASAQLRFHPGMTSLEDRLRRPALLSAITDDAGELQGVEITLLTFAGAAKAALETPRRVVGKLVGGAVRFTTPDHELLIAEGMESTASAAQTLGIPGWALLSALNLGRFTPPAGVSRLVVALDDDEAGHEAYARLQARLGSELRIDSVAPPRGCNDWNDWAQHARRSVKPTMPKPSDA